MLLSAECLENPVDAKILREFLEMKPLDGKVN